MAVCLFVCAVVAGANAGVSVVYVDADAPGGGDGSSWGSAFNALQDGIVAANATDADEIWVAEGTYVPTARTNSSDPRSVTFLMPQGVKVRGGFEGDEASPEERPGFVTTRLSGDVNGNDGSDFANYGENAYHVVIFDGADAETLLEGVLISGGNANASFPNDAGGGVLFAGGGGELAESTIELCIGSTGGGVSIESGATPRIRSVTIRDCEANAGGGMIAYGGAAEFDDVRINFCNAVGQGGGFSIQDGNHVATDFFGIAQCTALDAGGLVISGGSMTAERIAFTGCEAAAEGGGAAIYSGELNAERLEVSSCEAQYGGGVYVEGLLTVADGPIEFCSASMSGGGLYVGSNASVDVRGVSIRSCSAVFDGGGMYSASSQAVLAFCSLINNTADRGAGVFADGLETDAVSCIFENNAATGPGGAAYYASGTFHSLVNCRINGNSASFGGGVFYASVADGDLRNTTMTHNTASDAGGGVYHGSSFDTPTVRNSILYYNEDGGGMDFSAQLDTLVWDIGHSCIQQYDEAMYGGVASTGDEPGFLDVDGPNNTPGDGDDDLRLRYWAPLFGSYPPPVDAGSNAEIPADVYDLDGDGITVEQLEVDIDGNPRRIEDPDATDAAGQVAPVVDMGCYESDPDCNDNGVNDFSETSFIPDVNGNARPDDCDAAVVNVTQMVLNATLASELGFANPGDEIWAREDAWLALGATTVRDADLLLTGFTDIVTDGDDDLTLAQDTRIFARSGYAISWGGRLAIPNATSATLEGDTVAMQAGSIFEIGVNATGYVDAPDPLFGGEVVIRSNGFLSLANNATVTGRLGLQGGVVEALDIDVATGTLRGWGDLFASDLTFGAMGGAEIIADMQVVGNVVNDGVIDVQNGTLTVDGPLTNNGVINGDVFGARDGSAGPRVAGDGVMVAGEFEAGAGAEMRLRGNEAIFRAGGNVDIAINDNNAFDMIDGAIAMVGVADAQSFELMSKDVGADATGLDRTLTGHFPIGTLRVGPTATTVNLIDARDNDGEGQSVKEALYVDALVIDAGARLNTNGCTVYYRSLTLAGDVDDASNLVPICDLAGDVTGDGAVNFSDLNLLLEFWGDAVAPGTSGDATGDGTVNFDDLNLLLDQWGDACP